MHTFAAPRTDEHPGSFKSMFHVPVDFPRDEEGTENVRGRAFITVELTDSRISKELALRYGATSEGEKIEVVLRQTSDDNSMISKFPLPTTVKFAHPSCGSEYLQLGFDEVAEHFEISHYESKNENIDPSFLWLKRRADCAISCFDIPNRP